MATVAEKEDERRQKKKRQNKRRKRENGTYKQHHIVNMKNVFQEIHRATTIVSGSKSGGTTGQSFSALGHFQSIVSPSSLSPYRRCCKTEIEKQHSGIIRETRIRID